MNPIERPSTKRPFKHPFATNSVASSIVNAPQLRNMSTKQTAMHPSTFRMRLAFFFVVTCSTASANLRIVLSLKCYTGRVDTGIKISLSHSQIKKIYIQSLYSYLACKVFDNFASLVRITQRLDAVPDPHNQFICLPHIFYKLFRINSMVTSLTKHHCCII